MVQLEMITIDTYSYKFRKENVMQKKKQKFGLKLKLISFIIPSFIISLLLIIALAYNSSESSILSKTNAFITAESKASVNEIVAWQKENLSIMDTITYTMERLHFSDQEILTYLKYSINQYNDFPNGLYITYEDGTVLDGSGWTPEILATEGHWYQEGINHEKFAFGDPYIDSLTNEYIVTASKTLELNGKTAVAAADVSLQKLSETVKNMKLEDSGEAFIIDKNLGMILAHQDDSLVGKLISDITDHYYQMVFNDIKADKLENHSYEALDDTYMTSIEHIDDTSWYLVTRVSEKTILKDLNRLGIILIQIGIVILIIMSIVLERLVHFITKPIKSLTNTIVNVTSGDFTENIEVKGNDEITTMAYCVQQFLVVMRETLGSLMSLSEQLNHKAMDSNVLSVGLRDSASGQSDAMNQLNSTVEELVKAINEIAENATSLAMIVSEANTDGDTVVDNITVTMTAAEQGRIDMNNVTIAMKEIVESMGMLGESVEEVGEAAVKINEISNAISGIADETNLLALNASIEAARAGEAGRGFAVVANQIKDLAENSAKAAEEISKLIGSVTNLIGHTVDQSQRSMGRIKESTTLVDVASENFSHIYESINATNRVIDGMIEKLKKVDDVATSVAAITEEQSASAQEIESTSYDITNLAQVVFDNSNTVAEDSKELSDVSKELEDRISQFKI